MDDDASSVTSSNASFEEIGPRARYMDDDEYKPIEERTVDRLKALVAKSAAAAAQEIPEGEVPDVIYTLQYKERFGGKVTELCRSTEPIDIKLNEDFRGGRNLENKKPVLEIITKVSTAVVSKRRRPPPPPQMYDDEYEYDRYPSHSYGHGRYKSDENEMKITNVEERVMVINSTHLINALKAVVAYYPGSNFAGDTVKINAPYHVLVHYRAALARFKVNQPEIHDQEYALTTAKHIDILLEFLEQTLGKELQAEKARYSSATPKATFNNLWMLYKPGDVVYTKQDSKWTPFIICRCHDGAARARPEEEPFPYKLDCWNIIYYGNKLRRVMSTFTIAPFSGEDAISSLPVVPGRFFQGQEGDKSPDAVAERNIQLGKTTWELCKGPTYMSYEGSLVIKSNDHHWNNPTSTTGYMSGRVIVDCDGFNRYSMDCPANSRRRGPNPPPARQPPPKDQLPYFKQRCGCHACQINGNDDLGPFANFEDLNPASDKAPENDLYYLVLTKTVSGFILGERRWGHFNVESLEDIKHDKEAFKYLVLDEEIKLTVKALIGKFANNQGQVTPWPSDFVKNKGQGRIFLLHGSPGVGKTATCESIAELAHRPLLSLTSGDLSTQSFLVEKNLEYFLQLGERFGAMVLLDEADVYLETRRARDIARNGLVSIFLRALEYYRGVLFLTTNRVQTFDTAFTSRIHVALHYKSLSDDDREKIWLNSFDRLERDSSGKVHISVATREYAYESSDVQSLRWNGREIRNALQTAVALAETEALEDGQDKVTVKDKHLRAVVKMSRGFKNFLRQRQVRDDDRIDEDDEDDLLEDEEHFTRQNAAEIIYD